VKVVRSLGSARSLNAGIVGLVPTMGFFHEGHISLMERSVAECDMTVVTLFVNPLQFNEPDDLERYPQDQQRDVALAEEAGVDVMVIPSQEEMFSSEPLTRVAVGVVGEAMEGEFRPGHLSGVATVVAKLFAGLQPARAYFGRKDAQQLAMIRRMAINLSFPLEVVGCALIRESDGLALSSRNVLLGPDRDSALGVSSGLFVAADLVEAGERRSSAVEAAVRDTSPSIEFDYATVADALTMQQVSEIEEDVILAVAARVGSVRLIDNVAFELTNGLAIADRGVRIEGMSQLGRSPDEAIGKER
jgi:pantoate--beta-alanine ligase